MNLTASTLQLEIGTGGIRADYSTLASVAEGIYVLDSEKKIQQQQASFAENVNKYTDNNYTADEMGRLNRMMRAYGDLSAKMQAAEMLSNETDLKIGQNTDGKAQTVMENGKRTVYLNNDLDMNNQNSVFDAIVTMSHEARRDGTAGSESSQTRETRRAVGSHVDSVDRLIKDFGTDFLFGNTEMFKDYVNYKKYGNEYVDGAYDSSADYWKRMDDGSLAYDGKANLYDEEGNLITKTESQGIEGSLLELLGLKDTAENRDAVVGMMLASGMEMNEKGYWLGENESVQRKLPYNAGGYEYIARGVNLTESNMGKSLSLSSIDSLFQNVDADNKTVQNFMVNGYGSAIGLINQVGSYTDDVNNLLDKAYNSSEIEKVKTNREWLANAMENGIDMSNIVPGLSPTTIFEENTGDLALASSSVPGAKFFEELHTGIDYGKGGTSINTPGGIWQLEKTRSHRAYFSLFGSDVKMRIMHLDPGNLAAMTPGTFYGEGDDSVKITDYPTKSYGSGTGPHTHVDFTGLRLNDNEYTRRFLDSSSLMPGAFMQYSYGYKDANKNYLSGYPANFYIY